MNDLPLLPDHRPFNPCVNAGAIMVAGLVASGAPQQDARQITLAEARQQRTTQAGRDGDRGPFETLLERLQAGLPVLDDNARELILESAFRVACADGVIESEEDAQLRAIAQVLAINEGVLELEIARFLRQLAGRTNGANT